MAARKKPHPLAVLLGRRMERLRAAKGWSQADLGRRCGVSQKRVSDIERGVTSATLDTLARVAEAFDVPPFELLLAPGESAGGSPKVDRRKILSAIGRCDPRTREALWRAVEVLVDYRT